MAWKPWSSSYSWRLAKSRSGSSSRRLASVRCSVVNSRGHHTPTPCPRVPITLLQYLPETWYKFFYFDTALCWPLKGQKIEVKMETLSLFKWGFWWHLKKVKIFKHLLENWEPLKKLTYFPWIPRPLEPFLVDLRLKVFPIKNSTIIWRDCSEIILEIGLPYQKLLGNFQIQSQNFM